MRTLSALFAALLAFGAEASTPAKPDKATTCAACHGDTGVSSQPIYPNLAGQYRNYLVHALKEYRSGQRKNAIMAAQAKDLTEADIKALAAYYAAQPGPLYTPSVHTPPKK